MPKSTGMENRIERTLIFPQHSADFSNQLTSCLNQIKVIGDTPGWHIVQLSFFVDAKSNEEYLDLHSLIFSELKQQFLQLPTAGIIAQAPANGYGISVELVSLKNISADLSISYKLESNIGYTVLESSVTKEVYAAGITTTSPFDPFVDQVDKAYEILERILHNEGMDFSDITRQWNYVEDIIGIKDVGDEHLQNYQVLNDVRSRFYAKNNFKNGYPAATGIGMNSGGLVLEIYALQNRDNVHIVPVKNPDQVDAYDYSDKVLVGDSIQHDHKKTTPKFERAKYVGINSQGTVYISGTASIQNEVTVGIGDVEVQTDITINNIERLIDQQNLHNAGVHKIDQEVTCSFIRVYIKYPDDVKKVKRICERRFGQIPLHYLVADVCRDNLLVEIEGIAD